MDGRRFRWVSSIVAMVVGGLVSVAPVRSAPEVVAADSIWGDPVVVSRPDTDVQDAALAGNERGDVVAVWTRTGGGPTVEFARFDPDTSRWRSVQVLSVAGTSSSARPAVALEPDGDAIVVWEQWGATDRTVVSRRYARQTDTWSTTVAIDAPQPIAMSSARPTVVVDPSGNALAAWLLDSAGSLVVRTARFDATTQTWSAAVTVSTGSVSNAPVAVVDATGDVTLAWYRWNSGDDIFEAVRFDSSTATFGTVTELSRSNVSTPAYLMTIDLGVDAAGEVFAAFDRPIVGGIGVRVRRFDPTLSSWGTPVDLTGPATWASGAELAVLPSGDAIAVWRQFDAVYALRSSWYSAATQTWSTPIDVGTGDVGDGRGSVVLAPSGVATVVWSELRSGSLVTRSATSATGAGWAGVETLGVRVGVDYGRAQPRIAMSAADTVTVAWRDIDGVAEALFAVSTAAETASFAPVSPVRVFDTRAGESPDAVRVVPKVKVGGSSVLEVRVTDLAGVVPASGVGAVSMNVTVTNPEGAGFVTVYPCGPRSLVSSVNYAAGATVANGVIAPVSASGSVCFFSMVPTDLIVDLNGWFPAAG